MDNPQFYFVLFLIIGLLLILVGLYLLRTPQEIKDSNFGRIVKMARNFIMAGAFTLAIPAFSILIFSIPSKLLNSVAKEYVEDRHFLGWYKPKKYTRYVPVQVGFLNNEIDTIIKYNPIRYGAKANYSVIGQFIKHNEKTTPKMVENFLKSLPPSSSQDSLKKIKELTEIDEGSMKKAEEELLDYFERYSVGYRILYNNDTLKNPVNRLGNIISTTLDYGDLCPPSCPWVSEDITGG